MKRLAVIILVSTLVIGGLNGIFMFASFQASAYTFHNPLHIDGDLDFQTQAGIEGWPGNGSEGAPYIISGYYINASSQDGISILNTTSHFIIQDSRISGGGAVNDGITLSNVRNGIINNCTLDGNYFGISLIGGLDNVISNNTISYSEDGGIMEENSDKVLIENNNISHTWEGVWLSYGSGVRTIRYNEFYNINWAGVYVMETTNVSIYENLFMSNDDGIYIDTSSNIMAWQNEFWYNEEGIETYLAVDSQILNNEFKYSDRAIFTDDTSDLLIKDNTIFGSVDDDIYLGWSNNVTVENNSCISGDGYSIWLSHTVDSEIYNNTVQDTVFGIVLGYSDRNHVRGNNVSHNYGGLGIYFYNSCYNTVESNDVYSNSGIGVAISQGSHYNDILENTVNSNTDDGLGFYTDSNYNHAENNLLINNGDDGLALEESHNNTIVRNTVQGNAYGIYVLDSNNNQFEDNPVTQHPNYGMLLDNSDGNTINDSEITDNYIGIYLSISNDNQLDNNYVAGHSNYGIYLESANDNSIKNSEMSDNEKGAYLYDSHWNTLADNTISGNEKGVMLDESGNNTIHKNAISQNSQDGIYTIWPSSDNIISSNRISDNPRGMSAVLAIDHTIFDNIIENSSNSGLNLTSASGFLIYSNNFVNNSIHAVDDGSENRWNATYPTGGNYWDNLPLPEDSFSGPAQDIPGADSINDSAYIIDNNSLDNYPLMGPIIMESFEFDMGLNLVSLSLIPMDTSIESILSSITGEYEKVTVYDPSNPDDSWKVWTSYKPAWMNDLTDLDHTTGLFIEITNPSGVVFESKGLEPTDDTNNIDIYTGWNFVGFPSLTDKTRDAGLNNLAVGVEIDGVYRFDTNLEDWVEMLASDEFIVGSSYWIHANQDCLWDVPL